VATATQLSFPTHAEAVSTLVEMGVLHEITGRQQDRVFHNRAPRKSGDDKRSRRRETPRRLTCIISAGDVCIRNTATKII